MIQITPKEFQELSGYIKEMYGIHLKEEKTALLIGRLAHGMQQKGFRSFKEYFEYVASDRSGAAASELANKISTNHTFFMREAEHFHYFRDRVLPNLADRARDKDLRIWCAGCSSGQESYTLAMILEDYFAGSPGWDKKLLATDLSTKVLEQAVRGEYDAEQAAALPQQWRTRYMARGPAGTIAVGEKIKSEVIYRKFNLMEPRFPFKRKFHTIFCRNVMIYFDNPTKEALVRKFWEHTEPGGYLFVSQSESFNRETMPYKYVRPGVYRKDVR